MFTLNEKVLCYHGSLLYPAKILKVDSNNKEVDHPGHVGPHYYVHYVGWKIAWDEWVSEHRLLKHNETNVAKKKELENAWREEDKRLRQEEEKKRKSAQQRDFLAHSGSAAGGEGAFGNRKKETTRSTKRSRETIETAEDEQVKCTEMRLAFPESLKVVLVDDWENVTKSCRLLALPRSPTVAEILHEYRQYILHPSEPPLSNAIQGKDSASVSASASANTTSNKTTQPPARATKRKFSPSADPGTDADANTGDKIHDTVQADSQSSISAVAPDHGLTLADATLGTPLNHNQAAQLKSLSKLSPLLLEEVLADIKTYFDAALAHGLLYKLERPQLTQISKKMYRERALQGLDPRTGQPLDRSKPGSMTNSRSNRLSDSESVNRQGDVQKDSKGGNSKTKAKSQSTPDEPTGTASPAATAASHQSSSSKSAEAPISAASKTKKHKPSSPPSIQREDPAASSSSTTGGAEEETWTQVEPSSFYGAEHLLRLLIDFPRMVSLTQMDHEAVSTLKEVLDHLLWYLASQKYRLFAGKYEAVSPTYMRLSMI